MAEDIAVRWIRTNYVGYKKTGTMHEKYDVEKCGEFGGGGEYVPQERGKAKAALFLATSCTIKEGFQCVILEGVASNVLGPLNNLERTLNGSLVLF
ncbi:hypothetical protein SO802_003155 [Lithocarpus litseifolius]|uniref:alpha,alpha-trehalase n=1 Tax=Lithocarpus litseifolius TaxID=425828 RepID=A0AAW2E505_9ROSI